MKAQQFLPPHRRCIWDVLYCTITDWDAVSEAVSRFHVKEERLSVSQQEEQISTRSKEVDDGRGTRCSPHSSASIMMVSPCQLMMMMRVSDREARQAAHTHSSFCIPAVQPPARFTFGSRICSLDSATSQVRPFGAAARECWLRVNDA